MGEPHGSVMSATVAPSCCVAVAYSGGRDSTALLHATARAACECPGMEVLALHVHHGLSAQADAWLAHVDQTCAQWRAQGLPVRLDSRRVQIRLNAGGSVEAEARQVRYQALAEMACAGGADMVLLAHHRRDQAETFLLQALRGAGVNGLACMPSDVVREGVRWVRPWLRHARESIDAYVAHHGLAYIDDDSNGNTRFARNSLRLDVWPTLSAAFPHAEMSLAASAQRLQDVLPGVEVWRDDLLEPLLLSGDGGEPPGLDAVQWSELSGAQRRESLLHWYRSIAGKTLAASWVERLAHEVPGLVFQLKSLHWPEIGLGLYRGRLSLPGRVASSEAFDGASSGDLRLPIVGPGDYALPGWPGRLRVTSVSRHGVLPARLAEAVVRARVGGEHFQLGAGRPARSLKKQFQAMAVPSWVRDGPLIWVGDDLVFVSGLGVDARSMAPDGVPQWGLEWVADRG